MKKSLRASGVIAVVKLAGLLKFEINNDNIEQKRKRFKKLEKYFRVPRDVKIKPVETRDFKAEWITAPESRPNKILFYIHGGGFVFNSTKVHRSLVAGIARAAKLKALSLNYSLAPEYPFPKAVNETVAAYEWLLAQGYEPNNIAIAGDSAGGTLVLSLLQRLKLDKRPFPACSIVMSPATDAMFRSKSMEANRNKDFYIKPENLEYFVDVYFGKTKHDDPVASPLYCDYNGLPPLLIHVDKDEVMHDDSSRLAEKARKAGVEVELYEAEGLFHVWHVFNRYMPEAKQAISDISRFINKYVQ